MIHVKRERMGEKYFELHLNKHQGFCQMLETNFPDFPKNFPGIEISDLQKNTKMLEFLAGCHFNCAKIKHLSNTKTFSYLNFL